MLVITRKIGERFLIGDNIWIQIVDVDRYKVKVGIEAPKEISITREEILDKKYKKEDKE